MVLYCFVSVCLAFVIKGLVGFGDPLVSTPLLSVVLPNSVITPGLMPVSLLLNGQMPAISPRAPPASCRL